MEPWLQTVITVFCSVLASSGFWSFLQSRKERKDKQKEKEEAANSAEARMLLGLGHDRIIQLCVLYIDRGWVSSDEYGDLMKYLVAPYTELGGNGTVERLVSEVQKLPIKKMTYEQQAKQNTP